MSANTYQNTAWCYNRVLVVVMSQSEYAERHVSIAAIEVDIYRVPNQLKMHHNVFNPSHCLTRTLVLLIRIAKIYFSPVAKIWCQKCGISASRCAWAKFNSCGTSHLPAKPNLRRWQLLIYLEGSSSRQ